MSAAAAAGLTWRSIDPLRGSRYRAGGLALLLAPFTGPLWNVALLPPPGATLTVGRAYLALCAVLLLRDAVHYRERPQIPREPLTLASILVALGCWIGVSTQTRGCGCVGEVAGFAELGAVAILAAAGCVLEPRLRPALLVALVGGALLAAAMTVVGIDGLTPGTRAPSNGGRPGGPFGNPNYLAYTLAFAVPVLVLTVSLTRGAARRVTIVALAFIAFVLLLTYSRSGIIAAFLGTAVVLLLAHPPRSREWWWTVAAIAGAAVLGAALYPVFNELRHDQSRDVLDELASQVDRSGWEAFSQGVIPDGPSRMSNPSAGLLEVTSPEPGRGVSRAIGVGRADELYVLRMQVRALRSRRLPLQLALQDNLAGNGRVLRNLTVRQDWREVSVRWRPTRRSPDARLYAWTPAAGSFLMRRVSVTSGPAAGVARGRSIDTRLLGALSVRTARSRTDERDIDSRWEGVRLSLESFADHPVWGIGWGQFPALAASESKYGTLPTHNEYLRFVAELGMLGAAGMFALMALAARAAWRTADDDLGRAVLGVVLTGGVGLLFINGMVAPQVSAPLAIAVAVACARGRPVSATAAHETSPWWPTSWPAMSWPAIPRAKVPAPLTALRRAAPLSRLSAPEVRVDGARWRLPAGTGGLDLLRAAAPAANGDGPPSTVRPRGCDRSRS